MLSKRAGNTFNDLHLMATWAFFFWYDTFDWYDGMHNLCIDNMTSEVIHHPIHNIFQIV